MSENLKVIECRNAKEWDDFITKTENKNIFQHLNLLTTHLVLKKNFL